MNGQGELATELCMGADGAAYLATYNADGDCIAMDDAPPVVAPEVIDWAAIAERAKAKLAKAMSTRTERRATR